MLPRGTMDEPYDLNAWANESWQPRTRRAYAQKLAKLAEFQERMGTSSLTKVLAEFLVAKAGAGEHQSTLRGYNMAVWAAQALGWIDGVVCRVHKRMQHVIAMGLVPFPTRGSRAMNA